MWTTPRTLLRLPRHPVLILAKHTIIANALDGRINAVAGDYRRDSFGENPDVILSSSILHQESPDVCRSILERAHSALIPEGKAIFPGRVLDGEPQLARFATLHNLSAFVLWSGCREGVTQPGWPRQCPPHYQWLKN